jgi:predicted MFS family arabinose efflux permease
MSFQLKVMSAAAPNLTSSFNIWPFNIGNAAGALEDGGEIASG